MPVEIRELMIKTTIESRKETDKKPLDSKDFSNLKQQVVQECLKALKHRSPKDNFNR